MNAAIFTAGEVYILRGGGPVYRVLAHPTQVSLYQRLSEYQLELCSVTTVSAEVKTLCADTVLNKLMTADAPVEAGGPRRATVAELSALRLAALELPEMVEHVALTGENLLESHPAIASGLGFAFNGWFSAPMLALLRLIYDIRRFGDAKNPARLSKLRMYFRLASPSTFIKLFRQPAGDVPESLLRTGLLMSSWADHPYCQLKEAELSAPEQFLFREHAVAREEFCKRYDADNAAALSAWYTSARFSCFLYRLWLHGVGGTRFVPSCYFRRQDEVEAFKNYLVWLDKRVVPPKN